MSICSIRHRGLKRLYETGEGRDLPAALVDKISDILAAVDEAIHPREVGLFPGWRLHPLKGDLKGFWSVSVSGNWRGLVVVIVCGAFFFCICAGIVMMAVAGVQLPTG